MNNVKILVANYSIYKGCKELFSKIRSKLGFYTPIVYVEYAIWLSNGTNIIETKDLGRYPTVDDITNARIEVKHKAEQRAEVLSMGK